MVLCMSSALCFPLSRPAQDDAQHKCCIHNGKHDLQETMVVTWSVWEFFTFLKILIWKYFYQVWQSPHSAGVGKIKGRMRRAELGGVYLGRRELAVFRAVWEATVEGPRKWSEVVKMCYWWLSVVSDSGSFCAVFLIATTLMRQAENLISEAPHWKAVQVLLFHTDEGVT